MVLGEWIAREGYGQCCTSFFRSYATFVLTTDNELWGWGRSVLQDPVHIISNVKSVAQRTRQRRLAVITDDNVLWAWNISPDNRFDPVRVLEDVVYAIDIYAITSDGTLWEWFEPDDWYKEQT